MTPQHVKSWALLHTWTSLVCTLFLLLLCVTGLPLIFHDEIDGFFEAQIKMTTSSGPPATLDRIVASGLERYPGEYGQFIYWPPDQPGTVNLGLAQSRHSQPDEVHTLVLDARTAELLREPRIQRGVMDVVLKLHSELLSGLPGTLLLGAMGVLFLLALVSGVVLYGPFTRRLTFGAIRVMGSSRTRWLDLHNVLGVSTVVWALVVGLTGVVNTLEKPLFNMWRAEQLPKLLAPYAGRPQPEKLASVQDAVTLASQAVAGTRVTSVLFPYSPFNSPQHYLIWLQGDTPFTAYLFTAVMIDAASGKLDTVLTLPWYLKSLEMSRPLHFGDYGGLPLKLIWALLDLVTIVVLLSGIYLWIAKRRFARRARLAALSST